MNRSALLAAIAAVLLAPPPLTAQSASRVTLDWMFGEEGRALVASPSHHWLRDGTLLFQPALPKGAPWSIVDPRTGERTGAVDHRRARLSLGPWVPEAAGLPWPAEVGPRGDRALYAFEDDLFVLGIHTGKVRRLTRTPDAEVSARFSPDGRRLAFVRGNDLHALELATSETTRLTPDGSDTILNGTLSWVYWEEVFGRRDLGYWWSPDSERIAFLRTDQSLVTTVTFTDFLPEVPDVHTLRYPKAGTANPVVSVGVAAADGSDDVTWVRIPDRAHEYVVRVQWLPDARRLAVQTLNRAQDRLDLWFADAATGECEHVLTERDPGWVNVRDDLHFLADGSHFLWVSERSGRAHLYRYALDGTLVDQVTSGDWALKSAASIFWVRQAVHAVDEEKGLVYFTAAIGSSLERHVFRVALDGSGLQRLTKQAGNWSVSFSPDARHFVGRWTSTDVPSRTALYDAGGEELLVLDEGRAAVVERMGIRTPELSTVPAADGFPLPVMTFKPAGFDPARRHPLIVYTYGGPSARQVAEAWHGLTLLNQLLLQKGYVVAVVDNRSATGISKELENTILGRMSGAGELNDLVAAVRALKKEPWVDPERVGVWGWSNGGTMTIAAMTRSKEFRAGIAVAPVTRWHFYDTIWSEAVNKRPQDNPEGYASTDLVKRAKDLHGRLLLVHGTLDDNVHIQNTWAFVDALVTAGRTFDLMVYPGRKHGIADDPARKHLYRTMLEFWERRL